MSTLAEYQAIHGTEGLRRLADATGTKLSYLRQLICNAGKKPSADMALKLIQASGGKLTLEGLVNPVGQGSGRAGH